ncbi:MAG: hypothetical protein CMJ88_03700 [Planctomycetes bacterium]|nr:hypothetical protein [Planctomycetota bacterium]
MQWPPAVAVLVTAVMASGLRGQVQIPGDGVLPEAHLPKVTPVPAQSPFKPLDLTAFQLAVRALGGTALQVKTFAEEAVEVGPARAGDGLLRMVLPSFDVAVTAAEGGDPNAALLLAKVLVDAESKVVQAHARYHLARVFLDSDDPERALKVLDDYLAQTLNVSPLDSEVAYLYAQSLAEIPMIDAAIPRFRAFLAWFPDASERLRSTAHQRILELERQRESRLHMLADGMKKTTRDLQKRKTDKPVQRDQETYIEELDYLIEMFKEMENQSSGAPSGNGPSSNPASNSSLAKGDGSVGELKKRPSLADRWGPMRDSERKKIMADVQSTMPPQYRKMLEDYYKKLGKADRK